MSRGLSRDQVRALETLRSRGHLDVFNLLRQQLDDYHRTKGMLESQLLEAGERAGGPKSRSWAEVQRKMRTRDLALRSLDSDEDHAHNNPRNGHRPLESRGHYAVGRYRMMASLVSRGLCVAVLNVSPRSWLPVLWQDGRPYVNVGGAFHAARSRAAVAFVRKGWRLGFMGEEYHVRKTDVRQSPWVRLSL
jgi:hypothetical protein